MVARELAKCKLELVGIQEVRWDKGGAELADDCTFFHRNGNVNHLLGADYFVWTYNEIRSAVERV